MRLVTWDIDNAVSVAVEAIFTGEIKSLQAFLLSTLNHRVSREFKKRSGRIRTESGTTYVLSYLDSEIGRMRSYLSEAQVDAEKRRAEFKTHDEKYWTARAHEQSVSTVTQLDESIARMDAGLKKLVGIHDGLKAWLKTEKDVQPSRPSDYLYYWTKYVERVTRRLKNQIAEKAVSLNDLIVMKTSGQVKVENSRAAGRAFKKRMREEMETNIDSNVDHYENSISRLTELRSRVVLFSTAFNSSKLPRV